jgi:hypothetical protein
LSRWTFTATGEGIVARWADDRLLAVWKAIFTRVVLGIEKLSLGADVLCGDFKQMKMDEKHSLELTAGGDVIPADGGAMSSALFKEETNVGAGSQLHCARVTVSGAHSRRAHLLVCRNVQSILLKALREWR